MDLITAVVIPPSHHMSRKTITVLRCIIFFLVLSKISFGQERSKLLSVTGMYSLKKSNGGSKERRATDILVNGFISVSKSNKSYLGLQLTMDLDRTITNRLGVKSVTQYRNAQLGPAFRYYFLKLGRQSFFLQASLYAGLGIEKTNSSFIYVYPATIFSYGANLRPGINFSRKNISLEVSCGVYRYEAYKVLESSNFLKRPYISRMIGDFRVGLAIKFNSEGQP